MVMMPVRLDRRSLACAERAWCRGDALHCRNKLHGGEFVNMPDGELKVWVVQSLLSFHSKCFRIYVVHFFYLIYYYVFFFTAVYLDSHSVAVRGMITSCSALFDPRNLTIYRPHMAKIFFKIKHIKGLTKHFTDDEPLFCPLCLT